MPMTLFSSNPLRSAAIATIVVSIAHYGTKFMSSLHALQLTQTSIAIFSISALLFMIIMHHRMDGHRLMTQSQEEMALIGIFGLCWIVLIMAWRFFKNKQDVSHASPNQDDFTSKDFCLGEGVYCIFEEYTLF